MSFGRKRNIELDRAIADAALGRTAGARQLLQSLLAQDGLPKDEDGKPLAPDDLADFELAAARIYLAIGDARAALDQATKAESYFESKHLLDSELRSSLVAAQAAGKLNETATYKQFSEKSIDIQTELSHTWPFPRFNSYISRPDLNSQLEANRSLRQEAEMKLSHVFAGVGIGVFVSIAVGALLFIFLPPKQTSTARTICRCSRAGGLWMP